MTSSDHKYRTDIDGLRAIAVLSVVLFHAFPSVVRGGFAGVDIFFVISGFLITLNILQNLNLGRFTLRDFYKRRVRRIFPALTALIFITWVLGYLFLLPDEFRLLGKHISAGAAFVSNIILKREASYFDVSATFKPLLHLWSLGIEEQYYIFWPLTIFVLWKYKLNLTKSVLFLLLVSLAVNIFSVGHNPIAAFYLPQSRVWELLIGSLLAVTTFQKASSKNANAKSLLGLCLVIGSILVLNQERSFPGAWALLPTVGAFFIILAGEDAFLNKKILSHKALVYVGLISYPLYLWHWTILTYGRIVDPRGSELPWVLSALVVAFVLSDLTYRFVEKPIRFRKKIQTQKLCAGMAILLGAGWVVARGGLEPRLHTAFTAQISEAKSDWGFTPLKFDGNKIETSSLAGESGSTVLFLGDSHVEQYWPRFERLAEEKRLKNSVTFASIEGCPPFPNLKMKVNGFDCDKTYEAALKLAQERNVKKVVLGAYWEKLQDRNDLDQRFDELEKDLRDLRASGKEVVLILSNPTGDEFNPKTMIKSRLKIPSETLLKPADRKTFEESVLPVTLRLKRLAENINGAVINPVPFLCGSSFCATTYKGKPVYKDFDHMRPFYAREKASFLDTIVEN